MLFARLRLPSLRSLHDALRAIHRLPNCGHTQVIGADMSSYFDSIPHAELMKSVARRISDKHILHLIKIWLEPLEEDDDGKGAGNGGHLAGTASVAARKERPSRR